jgi:hypothetical protein
MAVWLARHAVYGLAGLLAALQSAVSASPDRWTTNSSASPAIRPTYKAGSRRHSYCRAGTIRLNT